ncbi:MAG: cell division protein FtsX [Pseudomonadota bacterium]
MTRAGLWRLIAGDPAADAAVPPSGATGHLTLFAAAALALMATLALALERGADRLAASWTGALSGAATLELAAGDPQAPGRAAAILDQTPGIAAHRPLQPEEVAALVAPWLDAPELLATLDLPRLIAIEETSALDRAALIARLAGEIPAARYVTHTRWRDRMALAAGRLRGLALGLLTVTLLTTGALVALAARGALAMHAQVLETLRLLGARDAYIARAFVRRFTLRTALGAALGTGLGLAVLAMLPGDGALSPALRPAGPGGWALLAATPLPLAAIGFAATRRAAFRVLHRIR